MFLDKGAKVFPCPSCNRRSCVGCKDEPHEGKTCEEMERAKKRLDTDRLIADVESEAFIHECPKCKLKFVKEESRKRGGLVDTLRVSRM